MKSRDYPGESGGSVEKRCEVAFLFHFNVAAWILVGGRELLLGRSLVNLWTHSGTVRNMNNEAAQVSQVNIVGDAWEIDHILRHTSVYYMLCNLKEEEKRRRSEVLTSEHKPCSYIIKKLWNTANKNVCTLGYICIHFVWCAHLSALPCRSYMCLGGPLCVHCNTRQMKAKAITKLSLREHVYARISRTE